MAKKSKPKHPTRKKSQPLVRPFKARPHTTANARRARAAAKPDYYGAGPSKTPELSGPIFLGPLVLPTNYDQAIKLIEELAGPIDAVLQAQKKHADSAAVTKRLKAEWDEAGAALSTRLRQAERDGELAGMAQNQAKPVDETAPQAAQAPAGATIGESDGSQVVN